MSVGWSIGRSVGWSVSQNFLKWREVTLPGFNRTGCLISGDRGGGRRSCSNQLNNTIYCNNCEKSKREIHLVLSYCPLLFYCWKEGQGSVTTQPFRKIMTDRPSNQPPIRPTNRWFTGKLHFQQEMYQNGTSSKLWTSLDSELLNYRLLLYLALNWFFIFHSAFR